MTRIVDDPSSLEGYARELAAFGETTTQDHETNSYNIIFDDGYTIGKMTTTSNPGRYSVDFVMGEQCFEVRRFLEKSNMVAVLIYDSPVLLYKRRTGELMLSVEIGLTKPHCLRAVRIGRF